MSSHDSWVCHDTCCSLRLGVRRGTGSAASLHDSCCSSLQTGQEVAVAVGGLAVMSDCTWSVRYGGGSKTAAVHDSLGTCSVSTMCKEQLVSMHRGIVSFGTERLTKVMDPKHMLFGFHTGNMRKQSVFVACICLHHIRQKRPHDWRLFDVSFVIEASEVPGVSPLSHCHRLCDCSQEAVSAAQGSSWKADFSAQAQPRCLS